MGECSWWVYWKWVSLAGGCTENGWVWLMGVLIGEWQVGYFYLSRGLVYCIFTCQRVWFTVILLAERSDSVFLPVERSDSLFYLSRGLVHCDFTCREVWFTVFLPVKRSGSLCFYLSRGLVHCVSTCREVWFTVFYLSVLVNCFTCP